MTFPLRGSDSTFRPFQTRIAPLYEHDTLVGWYRNNTNFTELESARERLELMVGEPFTGAEIAQALEFLESALDNRT